MWAGGSGVLLAAGSGPFLTGVGILRLPDAGDVRAGVGDLASLAGDFLRLVATIEYLNSTVPGTVVRYRYQVVYGTK